MNTGFLSRGIFSSTLGVALFLTTIALIISIL